MRAKVSRVGSGLGIEVPEDLVRETGLKEGQEVDLAMRGSVYELRTFRRSPTVAELFAEYEAKYGPLEPPEAVDWGPDVGAEILPDDDWSDIAPKDDDPEIVDAEDRQRRPGRG